MSAPVDEATRRRVVASARLLDSDKDGEALAAGRGMVRLLRGSGLDVAAVVDAGLQTLSASGTLCFHEKVMIANASADLLNSWEQKFVLSMLSVTDPTPRQEAKLDAIIQKIERLRN